MAHCGSFIPPPTTRREMLRTSANGFGALALGTLLNQDQRLTAEEQEAAGGAASRATHFPPKVKNVIYLYMDGGPSQVDSWDPKPRLAAEHGKPFGMKIEPTQFNNIGTTFASPWKFQNHGESGMPVSELFPHVAKHVDDLAVIRSMTSAFSEHTNANFFLHTGTGFQGRPSMGAWIGYGLGSEAEDLPAFVVLNGGLIPSGGLDNFNNGFLPATFQGSILGPGDPPVAYIQRSEATAALQKNKLSLLNKLDRRAADARNGADQLESAIANYELAYRMQSAIPELTDLNQESQETRRLYGMETKSKGTATFGKQCLLARRMVERGVRFVELTCPSIGHDRWDQHVNLEQGHADNARAIDQPIGALLTDLKHRGLFNETLIVWSGEFGRTPFAQGSNGRDHNPFGFSVWLTGGGIKGGTVHGQTDEYGYKAIENKQEVHDLHATMLHLLGMDHTRMTFRFSGRDMRLTDVHGHVIHEILA